MLVINTFDNRAGFGDFKEGEVPTSLPKSTRRAAGEHQAGAHVWDF